MEKKKNKKKKRSKFFWFMLFIIIIVILGLAWKFGFLEGLGLGKGTVSDVTTSEKLTDASEDLAEEETVEQLDRIEVKGKTYLWNDLEVDLKTLENNLSDLVENTKIELIDNQAIQNYYQDVLDLLTEMEIDYDQITN